MKKERYRRMDLRRFLIRFFCAVVLIFASIHANAGALNPQPGQVIAGERISLSPGHEEILQWIKRVGIPRTDWRAQIEIDDLTTFKKALESRGATESEFKGIVNYLHESAQNRWILNTDSFSGEVPTALNLYLLDLHELKYPQFPITFFNRDMAIDWISSLEVSGKVKTYIKSKILLDPVRLSASISWSSIWPFLPENQREKIVRNTVKHQSQVPELVDDRMTLSPRVRVGPKDDLAAIAQYYGGSKNLDKNLKLLQQRVGSVNAEVEIPVEELMGPFIKRNAYKFSDCIGPSCFAVGHSSAHHYRELPYAVTKNVLLSDFVKRGFHFVSRAQALLPNDVLVYLDSRNEVIHVASYEPEQYIVRIFLDFYLLSDVVWSG